MDVYLVWDDEYPEDRTMWGVCDSQESAEWLAKELKADHPKLNFEFKVESVRSYPST
jgi:hypothetical protein